MVEASASRLADPGFDSHLRLGEFSGVCPWGVRLLPRVVLGGQCSTVRVILCCLRCTVSRVVVFQEKCDTTRVSVPSLNMQTTVSVFCCVGGGCVVVRSSVCVMMMIAVMATTRTTIIVTKVMILMLSSSS